MTESIEPKARRRNHVSKEDGENTLLGKFCFHLWGKVVFTSHEVLFGLLVVFEVVIVNATRYPPMPDRRPSKESDWRDREDMAKWKDEQRA